METRKRLLFTILSLIIGIQTASAATGIAILDGPFTTLNTAIHNPNIVFGLTLIFFFSLLYGLYASALKFLPVFKSSEGNGIGRQGKVVALSLSGLSTLGVFYFTKGSPEKILQSVLDPFGIFAGLVLAALFAGIMYFGIRGNDPNSKSLAWAAVAAGFGMVIAGLITTADNIMTYGFLIMLIAMIFALFSSVAGGNNSGTGGGTGGTGPGGTGPGGRTGPGGNGRGPVPQQVRNFSGRMF